MRRTSHVLGSVTAFTCVYALLLVGSFCQTSNLGAKIASSRNYTTPTTGARSCIPETGNGCLESRYLLAVSIGNHSVSPNLRQSIVDSGSFLDEHIFTYGNLPEHFSQDPWLKIFNTGRRKLVWKAYLIVHHLQQLDDGELLLYLDDSNGLKSIDGMHRAMVCTDSNLAMAKMARFSPHWATRAAHEAYCSHGQPEEDASVTSGSSWMYIRKSPGTVELFKKWKRAVGRLALLNDFPSAERSEVPILAEHCNDQSAFNRILICDYGSPSLMDYSLVKTMQLYRIPEQRDLGIHREGLTERSNHSYHDSYKASQEAERSLEKCFPRCVPESLLGCRDKRHFVTGFFSFNNSRHRASERSHLRAVGSGFFKLEHIYSYSTFPDFILRDPRLVNHLKFLESPDDVSKRGGGYWFWKPFLIDHHLQRMNDGDLLVFMDADRVDEIQLTAGVHRAMLVGNATLALAEMPSKQNFWTKRAVFEAYCPNLQPESDDARQSDAGSLFIRKSPGTVQFFKKWQDAVCNWTLINDSPSASGSEYSGFKEHRHDQSLLNAILHCEYEDSNKTALQVDAALDIHTWYMYTIPLLDNDVARSGFSN
jgi:hypothetical protein